MRPLHVGAKGGFALDLVEQGKMDSPTIRAELAYGKTVQRRRLSSAGASGFGPPIPVRR